MNPATWGVWRSLDILGDLWLFWMDLRSGCVYKLQHWGVEGVYIANNTFFFGNPMKRNYS